MCTKDEVSSEEKTDLRLFIKLLQEFFSTFSLIPALSPSLVTSYLATMSKEKSAANEHIDMSMQYFYENKRQHINGQRYKENNENNLMRIREFESNIEEETHNPRNH